MNLNFLATPGGEYLGLYIMCLIALFVHQYEPEQAKSLLAFVLGALTMRMNPGTHQVPPPNPPAPEAGQKEVQ